MAEPGAVPRRETAEGWAERLLAGEKRALARLITRIEARDPAAGEVLRLLHRRAGRAHVVGVTGAPGAGKSTLITALARELRRRERSVAVLAVDPSSPLTGGALLGDRIRLGNLSTDPGLFFRSFASRGHLGGLSRAVGDAVRAVDAAGYEVVLVETVGAGQSEVEVAELAHTTLVVLTPNLGDDVQAAKAGLLEVADLFAVNKADLPGASETAGEIRFMLGLGPARAWTPPVVECSARTGQGVAELVEALVRHRDFLVGSGRWDEKRRQAAEHQLRDLLGEELLRAALERLEAAGWGRWVEAVARREQDPYTLSEELARRLLAAGAGGSGEEGQPRGVPAE
ncbi:MAG: methylmalonyl Co-A mutase-associated GTPase MeaB [Bacillota bacterium]|nr:methylmalonyl Co-A mutase-associated GTPase MeaB [Bacillota bacterium]